MTQGSIVYVTQEELEAMSIEDRNELLDMALDNEIKLVDPTVEEAQDEERAELQALFNDCN